MTADERGNPTTTLDRRHPDGLAWSRGNLVHPLLDGVEYFHRLLSELTDIRAGDQVYFSAWIGDQDKPLDGPGTSLAALLFRALRTGASVHALFWWPYLSFTTDLIPDNRRFVATLRGLGGEAVLDQRVRPTGSHHQKFLVIRRPERPESDIAFVGGIDPCPSRRDDGAHHGDPHVQTSIDDVYGEQPAWHDAHLQVRGPAVDDVEHCFRERWEDSTALERGPLSLLDRKVRGRAQAAGLLPAALPAPPRCGPHSVQLLRTYPAKFPPYPFAPRGERSVARGYAKALRGASGFVYVEDQFLWSPMVAETFAEALRREPELHLIAVVPSRPEKGGPVEVATSDVAHGKALDLLHEAGGNRVDVYELENTHGLPIYVHSKVCVIDDHWATIGSANLNRRSWTYDSELTAAVLDERCAEPADQRTDASTFAQDLRLRLWREHLGRAHGEDDDLTDPVSGIEALRRAAADLERWHRNGRTAPRPAGHLRVHERPAASATTRAWAAPVGRAVMDPDGRPLRHRWTREW
ncbi:phospholipase D family protein [Saccharopolyspora gloriosae]|uniref:phospholipase D family protein n=1 Tax=Saccharopolyspora gloriosae TaxID=455344 RepID=UPI001FB7736C|nr:phospholipase D family protein [Saccharopolyspora gloriosae]